MPSRIEKSDEAVFLAFGVLETQDRALPEVQLHAFIGDTRGEAEFTAQLKNKLKVVAHSAAQGPSSVTEHAATSPFKSRQT